MTICRLRDCTLVIAMHDANRASRARKFVGFLDFQDYPDFLKQV